MLVVLRDPAVLVQGHVGPSVRAGCVKSAESSCCGEHGPGSANFGNIKWKALQPRSLILLNPIRSWGFRQRYRDRWFLGARDGKMLLGTNFLLRRVRGSCTRSGAQKPSKNRQPPEQNPKPCAHELTWTPRASKESLKPKLRVGRGKPNRRARRKTKPPKTLACRALGWHSYAGAPNGLRKGTLKLGWWKPQQAGAVRFFSCSCTALLSPPSLPQPQQTVAPPVRMAAKAFWLAWICCTSLS